jgi:hypothetical protein
MHKGHRRIGSPLKAPRDPSRQVPLGADGGGCVPASRFFRSVVPIELFANDCRPVATRVDGSYGNQGLLASTSLEFMSPYFQRLRSQIGYELLLLPCVAAAFRDAQGRLLLQQKSHVHTLFRD